MYAKNIFIRMRIIPCRQLCDEEWGGGEGERTAVVWDPGRAGDSVSCCATAAENSAEREAERRRRGSQGG